MGVLYYILSLIFSSLCISHLSSPPSSPLHLSFFYRTLLLSFLHLPSFPSSTLPSFPHSVWPTLKPTRHASSVPTFHATSLRIGWSTSCPTRPHVFVCSQSEAWKDPTTSMPASLMDTGKPKYSVCELLISLNRQLMGK